MEKKSTTKVIIWAVAVSLLANILLSRWITAKISTLPLLNRLGLLSPQSPIVITQREEVRVADPASLLEAVNKNKGKISLLANKTATGLSVLGGAVNLTSDGLFLSVQDALPQTSSQKPLLVLSDGRAFPAEIVLEDRATGLVLLKVLAGSIPVISLGSSKDLQSGERVAIISSSLHSGSVLFLESLVNAKQSDSSGLELDSDRPSRAFQLPAASVLTGSAIVNAKGEVAGLISNGQIISADVIKKFVNLYFSSRGGFSRPAFGFAYKLLTKAESGNLSLPEGALVLEVKKAEPAQIAGLEAGDVITSVQGESLNEQTHLEEVLEKFFPQEEVKFEIYRQGQERELILKVGEL